MRGNLMRYCHECESPCADEDAECPECGEETQLIEDLEADGEVYEREAPR